MSAECTLSLLLYVSCLPGNSFVIIMYLFCRLVTVTFSDLAKTSVRIPATAHGYDLLGAVKGHLTSSASVLWVVNKKGQDYILKPESELVQFLEEDVCLFYALDPSHVVGVSVCISNCHKMPVLHMEIGITHTVVWCTLWKCALVCIEEQLQSTASTLWMPTSCLPLYTWCRHLFLLLTIEFRGSICVQSLGVHALH